MKPAINIRLFLAKMERELLIQAPSEPGALDKLQINLEPDFEDAPAPNWGCFEDECRWDAERIEATKSILFHEFIGRR